MRIHSLRFSCQLFLVAGAILISLPRAAHANTAIETETAQIGKQGDIGISNSLELEWAPDGRAMGTLSQFEYGITDRSEILIEPFFQEWEYPKGAPSAHGFGDLEITPSFEFVLEKGAVPAMLAAMKLKVPTGTTPDFSTGKFDYFPYIILGQHFLGLTLNANFGVNFNTRSVVDGEVVERGHRQVIWDVELEREVVENLTVFAEGFSAEEGIVSASAAVQYDIGKHFNVFVASGYNADGAFIVRPGFNIPFETVEDNNPAQAKERHD